MLGHKKQTAPKAPVQDKLGIYIHIPFCRSKCDYCDFYSLAGREDRMDAYQKALLAHLKETAPLARGIPVDTVYFGGGTPSLYGDKRLRELLTAIRKQFDVEREAEITLEANPDSVDEKSLRRLRKAGFNRLSLGMQSACQEELNAVHRPHTVEQADEAAAAVRKAKFDNLSLDLIYGLPGQTADSWHATVEQVLALEPGRRQGRRSRTMICRPTCTCGRWTGWLELAMGSMRSPTLPDRGASPATTCATGSCGPTSASGRGPTPTSEDGGTPGCGTWRGTSPACWKAGPCWMRRS